MMLPVLPEPHDGPPSKICGATNRAGLPCQQEAGWGTDHFGVGRCKLHGGRTPIQHGRYSGIQHEVLGPLIEQHQQDPAPLDTHPELAAARALFEDFLDRYVAFADALIAWNESYKNGERASKPTQILDVADAYRMLDTISKMVERIEKAKSADAISRPKLVDVLTEMSRIVELYVADPDVLQKIKDGWVSIRLA